LLLKSKFLYFCQALWPDFGLRHSRAALDYAENWTKAAFAVDDANGVLWSCRGKKKAAQGRRSPKIAPQS